MDPRERFVRAGQDGIEFRGVPFWSWNDDLQPAELRRQVRLQREAGLGGYFMHARIGLITPYLSDRWMQCIEATVDEGRKVGIASWLYDEDRWPSGSVGTVIPSMGEEWQQKSVEVEIVSPAEFRPKPHAIATFLARREGKALFDLDRLPNHVLPANTGGRSVLHFYQKSNGYADLLSPKVVDKFIELTYEAYWKRVGKEFAKNIPGIFTDEPNYRHVPWTEELPEYFRGLFGYDLIQNLPSVFFEAGDFRKIRHDFWRAVTLRYVETFSKRIYDWCAAHGIALTGHQLHEDTLQAQIHHIGAAMPHYEYMQIPGIDHLGRGIRDPVLPKQVSSVAHQMGGRRVLSEMFGCSGWNASFADLKWIAEWQYVLGIDLMCQHLELYSAKGCRKRDYPPSIYYQQPYWECYSLFNDYFARLGAALTTGRHKADILLLHPMPSAWAIHDPYDDTPVAELSDKFSRLSAALLAMHRDHDYGDELIMERHAKVEGSTLRVGACSYRVVIVPPSVSMSSKVLDMLLEFASNGGRVLCVEPLPTLENGGASGRLPQRLCDAVCSLPFDMDAIRQALDKWVPAEVVLTQQQGPAEKVYYQLREHDSGKILFLANTDYENPVRVTLQLRGCGRLEEWHALTGEIAPLPCRQENGCVAADLEFEPGGSHLLYLDEKASPATEGPASLSVVRTMELGRSWALEPSDPNALTLDYCSFRIIKQGERERDVPWSDEVPTIWLYRNLLQGTERTGTVFGRWGWKPGKQQQQEPGPPAVLETRFTFNSELDAGAARTCHLVLERPEVYRIAVNGKPVANEDQGWWCDISFRKIDISKEVVKGKNVITLSTPINADLEPESCYIIGDFTVFEQGERWPGGPPDFVLREPVSTAQTGDLGPQGFAFYRGNVRLRQTIECALEPGERAFVELERVDAALARVRVNGMHAGWLPWRPLKVEVTQLLNPGSNEVEVELFGTCRNLLGPHHHRDGELKGVGPGSFSGGPAWLADPRSKDDIWRDRYCFVPFGISGSVRVVVYKG